MATARKGGRPPTPAMEFVFSLPKRDDLRPTQEQWKKMIIQVAKSMVKSMDIPTSELSGIIRAVVHQQAPKVGKGSGDHCHVVIGKFTNNGKYLRALQKKGVLYVAKQAFNIAVNDVMNVDYTTYKVEQKYNSKKRAPLWKVNLGREYDNLKLQKLELAKFSVQADKWLQAFENANNKQLNRQFNRMQETIQNLENQKLPTEIEQSILAKIKRINKKSPNQLKFKQSRVIEGMTLFGESVLIADVSKLRGNSSGKRSISKV